MSTHRAEFENSIEYSASEFLLHTSGVSHTIHALRIYILYIITQHLPIIRIIMGKTL